MSIIKYNYNTDKNKYVGPHFQVIEFASFGNGKLYTNDVLIDSNLVNYLEDIFSKVHASKAIISSGYRNSECDKAVGGSGVGQHVNGRAADVCYYDKNGNIIPSKIIVCIAFDIGMPGTAVIDGNYSHLDTRTNGTYRGNESIGNSSYWSNPYSYFGVSKADVAKYTGESVTPSTPTNNTNGRQYQSHGVGTKWYPNVTRGDGDYAGVYGVTMDGLYIDGLKYRVKTNGKWLPEVTGRSDYAGIIGSPITDVAIEGATYRVHNKTKNYWLDWVSGYNINDKENGYAGNGSIIDAIEIK